MLGPLVLLQPYFRLDRDFPFAAVEGLPGAARGAGNDHLAHKCSLLWLIMNAKSLSKDLTRIRRDHAGLHQTPPGVGVPRGPRDEQGRIAVTSSAPAPWEFQVQLGPPGRGTPGPGLSDPPHRVCFSWDINLRWQPEPDPAKTSEVEVTFSAEQPSRTRVVLTHRHLDRHGEGWEQMRDAVSAGWSLARFAEVAARR